MRLPIAVAVVVMALLLSQVARAETKLVEEFKDWTLYSHTGAPADICFIASQPKEAKPPSSLNQASFFYVSHWPKDGVKQEVSIKVGREIKDGTGVSVVIFNDSFELFTKGDKAFVNDPNQELKLIDAMKRGNIMTVKLTGKDGQEVEEVYSLQGVTAAIGRLVQGCS